MVLIVKDTIPDYILYGFNNILNQYNKTLPQTMAPNINILLTEKPGLHSAKLRHNIYKWEYLLQD